MTDLPTLYQHYTAGGINSGLSANQSYFTLNGKDISIYSGAMHYFRVPKPYWRDRLRKMRAAGLNAVETYVPWNLHEPEIGNYDFGQGGSEFDEFLDIVTFLKTAQEEDLLAIVRPGPYICSEWEFGGLPSWLLRESDRLLRTSRPSFMKHVTRFFNTLLPLLAALQFTVGGPIIAFQAENEYGHIDRPDKMYLEQLRQLFLSNGINELLFTSDSPDKGDSGTLKEHFLMTANFARDAQWNLDRLKQDQPDKPSMAMEFWSGWYDHWTDQHNRRDDYDYYDVLNWIMQYPASVNLYMFLGGTNFGFTNGANLGWGNLNEALQPDTTSYDYDAPLSEAGDYTEKYRILKELTDKYNKVPTKLPPQPELTEKIAYDSVSVEKRLSFSDIVDSISESFTFEKPIAMELLPINNNSGQSYGYIVYRKTGLNIPANSYLKIIGHVCDTVMVLINGKLMSGVLTGAGDLDGFGYWRIESGSLHLGDQEFNNATLELVVENWGRNNFGWLDQFQYQFKGLWQGDVYVADKIIENWDTRPLEFKKKWTNGLNKWNALPSEAVNGPSLYKAIFDVSNPHDTFVNMREWNKGIVIVNGFVLGRYASKLGPQQTLYLPAPLLKDGRNEIVVFEHFTPSDKIAFSDSPIWHTP